MGRFSFPILKLSRRKNGKGDSSLFHFPNFLGEKMEKETVLFSNPQKFLGEKIIKLKIFENVNVSFIHSLSRNELEGACSIKHGEAQDISLREC